MTFLELCQRLIQEAGLSGSGPAAVTSQSGMNAKVVNWIASAWDEIQGSRSDWNWLYVRDATFPTVADDYSYSITTDLGLTDYEDIYSDTMRLYGSGETIANRTPLTYVPYSEWVSVYESLTEATGRPNTFTVTPDDIILMNPTPDGIYTVLFDYRKIPTSLAANVDEPAMPAHLHMAIVYLALRYYAAHDDAQGVYTDAELKYRRIYKRILSSQSMSGNGLPGALL